MATKKTKLISTDLHELAMRINRLRSRFIVLNSIQTDGMKFVNLVMNYNGTRAFGRGDYLDAYGAGINN